MRRRTRRWRWITGVLLALLLLAGICIRVVIARAQPILRARVIETLSARFKSRVDLADFHVWIADGLHVEGKGLKIFGITDPNPWEAGVQPLFEVGEFHFQTAIRSLFRVPMHVDAVYLSGLTMNIPPKSDRQQMSNLRQRGQKMSIAVDRFLSTDAKLIINTDKPGKRPLEFNISNLKMKDIGPGQPLHFDATLTNPIPVGQIQSAGVFGPLNEENPRDSAVGGDYTFTHADLATINGIGGILSSTGKYSGTLGRIEVEGQTDTPDFQLAVSGHPVPLHTDFHAIVDGTDGDTYLDPVNARLLHSTLTAKGKVVRTANPPGRDIELDVNLTRANIEDMLQLAVKTDPPIMAGAVGLHTKLSLPPGKGDVAKRLQLAGGFHIPAAHFTNEKIQGRIDSFSQRSLGKGGSAKGLSAEVVSSDLQGTFKLNHGVLSFSELHFQIPGTQANLAGQYSLDGATFDFHGVLRLDAKVSQLTTGWKSILLKPVDPLFHKHGAGAEIPFKIGGTQDKLHFGLDLGHKDEPASDKEKPEL